LFIYCSDNVNPYEIISSVLVNILLYSAVEEGIFWENWHLIVGKVVPKKSMPLQRQRLWNYTCVLTKGSTCYRSFTFLSTHLAINFW